MATPSFFFLLQPCHKEPGERESGIKAGGKGKRGKNSGYMKGV